LIVLFLSSVSERRSADGRLENEKENEKEKENEEEKEERERSESIAPGTQRLSLRPDCRCAYVVPRQHERRGGRSYQRHT
jgi:hypothetical protein